MLEVVVRLLPQGVLTHQGQLGETLRAGAQRNQAQAGREGGQRSQNSSHRPDVLVGCPQELHDEVDLVDLRGARQQRLVSQQLGEDAAHGPAVQRMCKKESVVAGEPPPSPCVFAVLAPVNPQALPSQPWPLLSFVPTLTTCQCWWSASSSPAAAQALGTCAGKGQVCRKPPLSPLQDSPRATPRQHSSGSHAQHSPQRDDFGGHGLWWHPVGTCQTEIRCKRRAPR